MPKKSKKKGGKGKKKAKKKTVVKKEEKKTEEELVRVPDGNDWIIMLFSLVPWEAQKITLFLNFECLVRNNMTFKSLRRLLEDKIGSVSRLTFYLNPPKKEEPLHLEECENFRLIELIHLEVKK